MVSRFYLRRLASVLIFALFTISFFVSNAPQEAFALDNIVINEIYPYPNTGEAEAIELYNPGSSAVLLDGWSVEDGTHKPIVLSGEIIDPAGYLVLEKGKDFSFSLNNDDDTVILKNAGTIVDSVAYGKFDDGNILDNALEPSAGRSLSRIPNGFKDTDLLSFRRLIPSLGKENILPVYSDKLVISEFLPHPLNGSDNEFIELENIGSDPIDFSGWQIDDADGGSSPFTIPAGSVLSAGSFQSFLSSTTGITLNDSGDHVRLLDPNGEIRQDIVYSVVETGESYSRFDNTWEWSDQLTPGQINQHHSVAIQAETKVEATSIKNALSLPSGSKMTIIGTVTAPPGILSKKYFYLQDAEAGIQVYFSKEVFPNIASGSRVQVSGIRTTAYREPRLKVDDSADITVLGQGELPAPVEIAVLPVPDEYVGRYIAFQGTKGVGDVVCGGSECLKIVFHISVAKGRVKKSLSVAGIYSRYNEGTRILPFREQDVIINRQNLLPQAGASDCVPVLSGSVIFGLCELLQKMRRRPRLWLSVLPRHSKLAIFWLCLATWEAARRLLLRVWRMA